MAKMAQSAEAPTQSVDLSSILARLEASEAKTKELEAKLNPVNAVAKSKEKYKGPWNYSYKMWGDVPVISSESVKKDKTKDFTYKNHLGVLVNNQFLKLTLADGSEVEVDAIEFGNNFTRSEKMLAIPMKDGREFTESMEEKADSYKFTHPTYGEFILKSNQIN